MFCTGLHRQPFLLNTKMGKVNKSITIDEDIAKAGEEQAIKERRSFSSFIEFLVDSYLSAIKPKKDVKK
jgi:hypothetical protein